MQEIGANRLAEKLGQGLPPQEKDTTSDQPASAAVSFLHSLFMVRNGTPMKLLALPHRHTAVML